MILSRQGRGGKLTVKFNQEAFNETAKFFGLFVLVSNKAQDCFEALEDYRLREKQRKPLEYIKNIVTAESRESGQATASEEGNSYSSLL